MSPLRGAPGFDWLTERLAIGGALSPGAAERLVPDHDISCVVDVRAETRDDRALLRRHGVRLLHLPTPDRCALAVPALIRGVAWVSSAFEVGRRVLIHCQHGIGRSALLALCVLVESGMSPIAALRLAKDAREIVSPSPDQLAAFIAFAARRRRAGACWALPAFDELATIAYRHLKVSANAGGAG